jgi:hypothetical protein
MKNYRIALIVLIVLIGGGGVGFIITGFATSGSLSNEFTFAYDPSSPAPIESLNLNADIGKININYNTTNTSLYAYIAVHLEISGLFMSGKSYTDFFATNDSWWNPLTASFNMKVIPDVWFDPSHWFKSYNITIDITLRTDVVYDITAITGTGAITMNVPDNVKLNGTYIQSGTGSLDLITGDNVSFDGSVRAETSTGSVTMNSGATNFSRGLTLISSTGSLNVIVGNNSIVGKLFKMQTSTGSITMNAAEANFTQGLYSFTSTGSINLHLNNCLIGDDLSSEVSTGSITYYSYNMKYSQDITISLKSSTGSINAQIYQYSTMGANVTGTMETSTGSVTVLYRDSSAEIGVRFTGTTSTGTINYTPHASMEIITGLYQSYDYSAATSKYYFDLITSTGNVNADAQSP